MNNLLRFLAFVLTIGSTFAQSNLPACEDIDTTRWSNCFGTSVNANGKYTGEHKDGKRNGQGYATYADGSRYVGEHKDGKREGQGTYFFADGGKYVGAFRDGKRNGEGLHTLASRDMYFGEYKDDKRDGQGSYTFASGEKYVGLFKDNQPHGYGIRYSSTGSIIQQGRWDKEVLVQTVAVDTQRFPFNPSSIQSVQLSPSVDELERQREVRERQRQAKERADRERPAREAAQRAYEAQTQRELERKQIQEKLSCENLVQTCVTQIFRGKPLLETIANNLYIHPDSIKLDRTSKSTCSCNAVFYTPKGTTTCQARFIEGTRVQCNKPNGENFYMNQ